MRFVIAALVLAPGLALAQNAPAVTAPAQNGNVYDGTAHQPSAGVQQNEQAAGIAPSRQQAQQENADLDQMGKKLVDKVPKNTCPKELANC